VFGEMVDQKEVQGTRNSFLFTPVQNSYFQMLASGNSSDAHLNSHFLSRG